MATDLTYDVIVIGGGLAGLRAARDLGAAGKSVLVLEAQDRLGGRVYYDRFADTATFLEYGGGWVNPGFHKLVGDEIARYDIKISENDMHPAAFRWLSQGVLHTGASPVPPEDFSDMERGIFECIAAARRIAPGQAWDKQDLVDLDVSWEQFIKRLELRPAVDEYFLTWCSSTWAHELNALDLLTWVAAFGNSPWAFYAESMVYKFDQGTKALVDALADDSGAEIRLSSPVAKIAQDDTRVWVDTRDGERVGARAAVFAVPFNVWQDIEFEPRLGELKREASRVRHPGRSVKVWAVIENTPREGLAGWGNGDGCNWLFQMGHTSDGGALHVGFSGGHDLDPTDLGAIERAARVFAPDAKVIKAAAHDWRTNEFFKGTWMVHRPGEGLRYHSALAAAEGKISFAGSDVCFGWNGWMEGALETGARAALEALEQLQTN